jgi:hypothetical protein
LKRQAERFGVRVYNYANSGNHIHILVRPPRDRAKLAGFLRALSGLIARLTLKAERGCARGIRFWDHRPFSRVVPYGRRFETCWRYVARNTLAAFGFDEADEILRDVSTWRPGAG